MNTQSPPSINSVPITSNPTPSSPCHVSHDTSKIHHLFITHLPVPTISALAIVSRALTYISSTFKTAYKTARLTFSHFVELLRTPKNPSLEQRGERESHPHRKRKSSSRKVSSNTDYVGWGTVRYRSTHSSEITAEGQVAGTEKAVPIPTRDLAVKALLKTQKIMEHSLETPLIISRRNTCDKALASVQNRAQDWIHSYGMRETFERGSPEKVTFVEPPNCFMHSLTLRDAQRFEIFRLGAMVHKNGFTHISDLCQSIETDSPPAQVMKLREVLQRGFYKKENKPLTQHQREAITSAITNLENPKEALIERQFVFQQQMLFLLNQQIQFHPPRHKSTFTLCHQTLLNPSKESLENCGWMHNEKNELEDMRAIFEWFDQKEIIFSSQESAPYISERGTIHLPAPKGIEPGKRVKLETCLLNTSVQRHTKEALRFQQKLNSDGIKKVEQLLIKRAQKILNSQSTTLSDLFDELSKKQHNLMNRARWLTLQQLRDAMETFSDIYHSLTKIKNISKKDSSYDLAVELAKVLLLINVPLSSGCLSAKDRTGYMVGKLMVDLTIRDVNAKALYFENLSEKVAYRPAQYKKYIQIGAFFRGQAQVLQPFLCRALDSNSIAMKIVRENCEQSYLKAFVFPIKTSLRYTFSHLRNYLGRKKNG